MKLSLALANLSLIFIAACCSAPAPAAPPEPPTEPPATTEPPVVTPPVETPAMCGGIAAIKCPAGSFCDVAGHCGAGDQSGVCAELPTVCTRDLRPVCGCDGKTYGNACTAHASGVSVASEGECQHP